MRRVCNSRFLRKQTVVVVVLLLAMALLSGTAAASAPLGSIIEFETTNPETGTQPSGIATGPDQNIWFADDDGLPAIERVTPSGQMTRFTAGLTPSSRPLGIAQGPDGNMWFTDSGTEEIGRITPSGQITEYSAGLNPGASPVGITPGADGNVWFTDDGTKKAIGRITPSGQITEYSAGLNAAASPNGIAEGADGNVWFTDDGTRTAIGRITPSGQISEYSRGLEAGDSPQGIAPGPDGNLWFADGQPAIGRITPDGQITEYSAGLNSGAGPVAIAPGPDGQMWFADQGQVPAIGRVTMAGQINEFSVGLRAASLLTSIAPGSDGNMWFGDEITPIGSPGAIGRIGTGVEPAMLRPPAQFGSAMSGSPQVCGNDAWANWAGAQPSETAFPFDGFDWTIEGNVISGATGASYTPTDTDVFGMLSCQLTVTYPLPLLVTVSATSPSVPIASSSSEAVQRQIGGKGKVQRLTCKVSSAGHGKARRTTRSCTAVELARLPGRGDALQATLSRDPKVYATGTASPTQRHRFTAVLKDRRALPIGRYELTLRSHRGPHRRTEHEQITIA